MGNKFFVISDDKVIKEGDTVQVDVTFPQGQTIIASGTVVNNVIYSGGQTFPHISSLTFVESIPIIEDEVGELIDQAFLEEIIWYAITEGGEPCGFVCNGIVRYKLRIDLI